MFGLHWSERPGQKSSHPMTDAAAAAHLIRGLPLDNPNNALAEAAAWLESIAAEGFAPTHTLNLVSMLDETVRASLDELTLAYVGAKPGSPGLAVDWRVLTDYLERLGSAYCALIEHAEVAPRLPVVLLRAMRAITCSMKVSWLRYLPPDRGSWESLVRCYRAAGGLAKAPESAYAADGGPTCALDELTVGVMLAAAAPQSLTPRQVEIAYRMAFAHRSEFTVNVGRAEEWCHYLFDLDNPGTPARIPAQIGDGEGLMFFSAEGILPQLKSTLEGSRSAGFAMMPDVPYGHDFGASEKLRVVEHVMRFWDDTPPSRQHERKRINTKIHVEIGAEALRAALETTPSNDAVTPGGSEAPKAGGTAPPRVAPLNVWTLTDFSTRGIGARFSRRLDRWLKVGSLVAFRLERSEKWCVAVVRRLRTDARNQTDVGCQIVAKAARLVKLEGLASRGTMRDLAGSGAMVHSTAVLLPEDAQLDARASLLFEPGTNAPGQSFVMRHGDTVQQIKLGAVAETVDGRDRVEFDVIA